MNSKIQGSKRFWFVCYCFAICPIKKTKAWRQSLTRWKSRTTSIKSIRKDNGWGNFRDNTCMETCIYFIPLSWYQFTRTFCRSFFFFKGDSTEMLDVSKPAPMVDARRRIWKYRQIPSAISEMDFRERSNSSIGGPRLSLSLSLSLSRCFPSQLFPDRFLSRECKFSPQLNEDPFAF